MGHGSCNYHFYEGIGAHCNQAAELYLPGNLNFPWTYSSAASLCLNILNWGRNVEMCFFSASNISIISGNIPKYNF